MRHLAKLGLLAIFVVAACSSTKDALFDDGGNRPDPEDALPLSDGRNNDPCDGSATVVRDGGLVCDFGGGAGAGGKGGAGDKGGAGGASGGTGGGAGAGGKGGAGGARSCPVECARPYECKLTCGGPVLHSGCCMCEAPYFDDFLGRACAAGGSGGAAGSAGSGGRAGGAAAGSGGSGGSGGSVAGNGGSGRGGSMGAVAGSGGSATAGSGGAGAGCGSLGLCARPYECIATCGGPLVTNDCCPCQAPLFDNFGDIACRNMGTPTITYAGCSDSGDLDHLTIAKRDTSRDLCVKVSLVATGASTGIIIRNANPAASAVASWAVEQFGAGPAAACATSGPLPYPGQSASGTMTALTGTIFAPLSLSLDLSINYQSPSGLKTERLDGADVSTSATCGSPLVFQ